MGHKAAMDGGANAIAGKSSSRHCHACHILLIQLLGIGMEPSLQTVSPGGGPEEIHLVAKEIDNSKSHYTQGEKDKETAPPHAAIHVTEEKKDIAGHKHQQCSRKILANHKCAYQHYRGQENPESTTLVQPLAVDGYITGKENHQHDFGQFRRLEGK